MLNGIGFVATAPDGTRIDLTPRIASAAWATVEPGGFADATFILKGDQRRLVPYLSLLQITWGMCVVYEGLVEDKRLDISSGDIQTVLTVFGKKRLLAWASIRRMWVRRQLQWQIQDSTLKNLDWTQGQIDPTNPATSGVQFTGNNTAIALNGFGPRLMALAPQGMVFTNFAGSYTETGTLTGNFELHVESSSDGAAFTDHGTISATGNTWDVACVANARIVSVRTKCTTGSTPANAAALTQQLTNLRVRGISTVEDASGGYYGGTILKDLIALVPGLSVRNVEAGSDFTIPAIDRSTRDSALSVVQEVSSYYQRAWGVYEDGKFDWVTRNQDETQWVASISQAMSGSLENSLATLGKNIYVEYTDPGSNAVIRSSTVSGRNAPYNQVTVDFGPQANEATASSTDQRNPFVRVGYQADLVVQGGQLTSTQAAQLASQLATSQGTYPTVQGTLVFPLSLVLQNATSGPKPIALARAGDNLMIHDLPVSLPLDSGRRDGETCFHIIGTECDLAQATITLTLEAQQPGADVQLARIGAQR